MSVNLPDELAERLAAEAARRGVSVDDVAAELLASHLPEEVMEATDRRRLSFSGIGSSGGAEAIGRNHEKIIRQAFAGKTARNA